MKNGTNIFRGTNRSAAGADGRKRHLLVTTTWRNSSSLPLKKSPQQPQMHLARHSLPVRTTCTQPQHANQMGDNAPYKYITGPPQHKYFYIHDSIFSPQRTTSRRTHEERFKTFLEKNSEHFEERTHAPFARAIRSCGPPSPRHLPARTPLGRSPRRRR